MRQLLLLAAVLLPASAALAESPTTRSAAAAMAAAPGDDYPLGPDSQRQKDVPQGTTISFVFDRSQVYPGTTRTITVYIPAQYLSTTPACLYVGLDGLGFNAPIVFDNLIHKKQMPVTIAIGISPGQVAGAIDAKQNPRFNRSNEFDSMDGRLGKLVEEVLQEAFDERSKRGTKLVISKDPNDRAVGGGSTGAIGAFTLAWQHPESFRRVFSAIGTYVGMRGGDQYPVLIRKTEPKPLRIFMQDGAQDEWMGGPEVGDWWMSNQTMQRAVAFAGYQVEHVWGTGPHSGKQAAAVFPDAMRWLWKDWPQPIKAGESQNVFLRGILQADETSTQLDLGYWGVRQVAADSTGEVWVMSSGPTGSVRKLSSLDKNSIPPKSTRPAGAPNVHSFAIGPKDEQFQAVTPGRLGEPPATQPAEEPPAKTLHAVTVMHNGDRYGVQRQRYEYDPGQLWHIPANGDKPKAVDTLRDPSCVAVSPDGQWLAVLSSSSHHGDSFRVQPDGSLTDRQRFYWLHVPDDAEGSGASAGACFDRDGRLYVATAMGVQVLDRNGRSRAILPMPEYARASSVCFGGKDFDTLYVTSGGTLYKRKMKSRGLPPAAAPIKLPPWGAG